MDKSAWINNKLFSAIYVLPDEVTFIKDDIHTHSQKLTIYNTTPKTLKYEIIKATPAKINFIQSNGVINPQCISNIYLHLLEFPHIDANHSNFSEKLCDDRYGGNLAILKFHDKKGHLIDQKFIRVIWLRFRPSLNYKHLQLQPKINENSSEKLIKEVENEDFYMVNYPQIPKNQSLDNALRPYIVSTADKYKSESNSCTSYSNLSLMHNRDNSQSQTIPSTTQKSILKTSPQMCSQSPFSKKRITFTQESCEDFSEHESQVQQLNVSQPSHQNIMGRPSLPTINWFTVSLLSGCLIILALPNEVTYDNNQNSSQQICIKSNSSLSNSEVWWAYVWPPRVSVQTKIIASYILGLITMAFLRN